MNKKLIPVAVSVLMMQGIEAMAEPTSSMTSRYSVASCIVQNPNDSISAIEDDVKAAIAKHLGIDKSRISRNSDFVKDLGADSLDVVEIVIALEKQYGFEFADDELNNLKKVGDIVAVIENRKRGGDPSAD